MLQGVTSSPFWLQRSGKRESLDFFFPALMPPTTVQAPFTSLDPPGKSFLSHYPLPSLFPILFQRYYVFVFPYSPPFCPTTVANQIVLHGPGCLPLLRAMPCPCPCPPVLFIRARILLFIPNWDLANSSYSFLRAFPPLVGNGGFFPPQAAR